MKSLQESLFDQDLVDKEITIRQLYKLLPSNRGLSAMGMPIGQMFSVDKLNKYPHSFDTGRTVSSAFEKLVGIIVDMPVPTKEDVIASRHSKWSKDLKNKLSKYVKRDWRMEFEKVDIYLEVFDHKELLNIDIDYNNGAGIFSFIFTKQ